MSFVDLDYPERNRDVMVQTVTDMERHNWSRPGVHISVFVPMPDYKAYTMRIPYPQEFPSYEGHCVLLKQPSRDFYQRHQELYQAAITCAGTKKAMDAREIAIEGDPNKPNLHAPDPSRHCLCVLLVFPKAIENNHFGHGLDVSPKYDFIKLAHNHELNTFEKDIRSMCIGRWLSRKEGFPYVIRRRKSRTKTWLLSDCEEKEMVG